MDLDINNDYESSIGKLNVLRKLITLFNNAFQLQSNQAPSYTGELTNWEDLDIQDVFKIEDIDWDLNMKYI